VIVPKASLERLAHAFTFGSVNTLRKYAQAIGCRLEIRLRPRRQKKDQDRHGPDDDPSRTAGAMR
jgi:hypothetical protein